MMGHEKQRSAMIERTLRLCALVVDPSGKFTKLAPEMGVSPQVFRYWINKGVIPATKARWLEARFPEIVKASDVSAKPQAVKSLSGLSCEKFSRERGVSVERLHELFDLREDGTLVRKIDAGTAKVGTVVGTLNTQGYLQTSVDGRVVVCHRIVFAMVAGKWPVGFIDHINGDKKDNRFANLREATGSQNGRNRKATSRNLSGRKGIYRCAKTGKWKAGLRINGKHHYIGRFTTLEEAAAAYEKECLRLNGEFSPFWSRTA